MNRDVVEQEKDYRKFPESIPGYIFRDRLVSPLLLVTVRDGAYVAVLAAGIRKNGVFEIKECPSNDHNWVFDGNIIWPLPCDAPAIFKEVINNLDPYCLSFSDVIALRQLSGEELEVRVDGSVFEKANSKALKSRLSCDIEGLNATLYPYQEQGVAWMRNALASLGGVILADEMGLGKTLQIIALLMIERPVEGCPALIVCPSTLIDNWCREIEKFSPVLTYLVHRGGGRSGFYKDLMKPSIVITTYDTLVNDIAMFAGIEWTYLVCDEAQAVKNPVSKRRSCLDRVPRRYAIPVTGTPMENSLLDLWSLADLAIPGLLGTKEYFALVYPDTEDGAELLGCVTDVFILKRQVSDVANDLPERTNIDVPVALDEDDQREYRRIRDQAISDYGAAGRLVAINLLSLYCAHPWLRVKKAEDKFFENSVILERGSDRSIFTPKMEVCVNLLREAISRNKKVLIFAAFNRCGELISRAADQAGVPKAYWGAINGSTPQEDRQMIVDEFSAHEGAAVLVLNPRAAGAGLNITEATIVIHYTQNWNPALEMQASARAHRRGQAQPVIVYRLFYKSTVEETMIDRAHWKSELGSMAVPITFRDDEDIRKALSLGDSEGIWASSTKKL